MDLTEPHERALTRMAASLASEERHSADPRVRAIVDFRPEAAVELATKLLADGIETPSMVGLASLPTDVRVLHRSDVEPLARSMLGELGVAEMLPLSELWEESVGSRRGELEDEIRAQAERVVVAAENVLAGNA